MNYRPSNSIFKSSQVNTTSLNHKTQVRELGSPEETVGTMMKHSMPLWRQTEVLPKQTSAATWNDMTQNTEVPKFEILEPIMRKVKEPLRAKWRTKASLPASEQRGQSRYEHRDQEKSRKEEPKAKWNHWIAAARTNMIFFRPPLKTQCFPLKYVLPDFLA